MVTFFQFVLIAWDSLDRTQLKPTKHEKEMLGPVQNLIPRQQEQRILKLLRVRYCSKVSTLLSFLSAAKICGRN